jgi:hypothetical protein
MPAIEIVGSAILSQCGKIIDCCCGLCKTYMKTDHEGILIPFLKTSLCKQLVSDSILFVDLDHEIDQSLDEDDKKLDVDSHLYIARLYNNAKKIVAELSEMNEMSKSLKTILFVSCDYKLLKYCGLNDGGIDYFICSDSLHEQLKGASNWNEGRYDKIKDQLIANKKEKLHTYSSLNDLIEQVIVLYPEARLKI